MRSTSRRRAAISRWSTYTQDKTEAVIEVRDNGIGIDPEDMPHIFKRFWWANRADYPNPGSIGLGLALAKKVIELHKGRIEVESARDARQHLLGGHAALSPW